MLRFALRHFTAILILIVLGWWLGYYVPNSPTWSVLLMKQAIDARDGDGQRVTSISKAWSKGQGSR